MTSAQGLPCKDNKPVYKAPKFKEGFVPFFLLVYIYCALNSETLLACPLRFITRNGALPKHCSSCLNTMDFGRRNKSTSFAIINSVVNNTDKRSIVRQSLPSCNCITRTSYSGCLTGVLLIWALIGVQIQGKRKSIGLFTFQPAVYMEHLRHQCTKKFVHPCSRQRANTHHLLLKHEML